MRWKTAAFVGGALFTVGAPILFSYIGPTTSLPWISALCGAFVTVLSRFDNIVELSLGPVRARMKETLAEANATINQLQNISATIAEVVLTDVISANFWGDMTLRQRFELRDKVISALTEIGISPEALSRADTGWRKGIALVYNGKIFTLLGKRPEPNRINVDDPGATEAAREFNEMVDYPNWIVPSPDKTEEFIRSRGRMTDEIQEWIDDYRHFQRSGEIRRMDTFLAQ